MKNLIYITILLTTLLFTASCEKNNDDVTPALPNTTSNNNNNNNTNNVTHGTDYMQYKIDGTAYDLNNANVVFPNSVVGMATLNASPFLNDTLFQLIGQLTIIDNSTNPSTSQIHFTDTVRYAVQAYTYGQVFTIYKPSFMAVFSASRSYISSTDTECNLQFTRIDDFHGGKVEGTFSFTKLNYIDGNGNVLSGNHVLTDGKFSLTVN